MYCNQTYSNFQQYLAMKAQRGCCLVGPTGPPGGMSSSQTLSASYGLHCGRSPAVGDVGGHSYSGSPHTRLYTDPINTLHFHEISRDGSMPDWSLLEENHILLLERSDGGMPANFMLFRVSSHESVHHIHYVYGTSLGGAGSFGAGVVPYHLKMVVVSEVTATLILLHLGGGGVGLTGPTGPAGAVRNASGGITDISGLDASFNEIYEDISGLDASAAVAAQCCIDLDASMNTILQLVKVEIRDELFFNPPPAPTNGSGQLLTSGMPKIQFTWTNPPRGRRAAFHFTRLDPRHSGNNHTPGYDEYNYLPYHQGVKIEYRLYSLAGVAISSWRPVPQSNIITPWQASAGIHHFLPRELVQAEIDASTTGSRQNGDLNSTKTTYSASIVGSQQCIQIRVAMINGARETIPDISGGGADASWNWLYIPDGSGNCYPLGNFGHAPPPKTLSVPPSSLGYKSFTLTGRCDNPNNQAPIADVSLNTPLSIPNGLSLRVQYRVDMSGVRSPESVQVGGHTGLIDISYSHPLTLTGERNSWSIPLSGSSDPIYPQHDYQIYAYYMRNSSDLSQNILTTLSMPSNIWTTGIPGRNVVTNNYVNFLSPSTLAGRWEYASGTGVVPSHNARTISGTLINTIYFLNPADVINWFGFDFFNVAANGDDNLGLDTSGQPVMYFEANMTNNISYDISSNIFNGWTHDPASIAQDVSNNHIHFNVTRLVDANNLGTPLLEGGYYLGTTLTDIEVSGVDLTTFPDISNNTYSAYEMNIYQHVRDSSASAVYTQNGPVSNEFNIGARPQFDISNTFYDVTTIPSSVRQTLDFFGLKNLDNTNPGQHIVSYDISLNDIYTTWAPENDQNLTNVRLMFSANWVSNEWDSVETPWNYPLTSALPITNTLSLPALKINTYKYSRAYSHNPQFRVVGTFDNNVLRPNRTTSTNPRRFADADISFNGKPLWWDKTYNFTPAISALYNVGIGEHPTNYSTSSAAYSSFYNNSDAIQYNQLMWANGGFTCGTYTPATDNPYIDYSGIFYWTSPAPDYSNIDASGDFKNVTHTVVNDDYWDENVTVDTTIMDTYKWLILKSNKPGGNDFARVVVKGGGSTLTLGTDYILYVQEIDTYFHPANSTIPANHASGRSGWKAATRKWDQGLTVQLNNAHEAGCYRRRTNTGAVALHSIKLYSPNTNVPVFYRIGLANGSNKKISEVTITYGTT